MSLLQAALTADHLNRLAQECHGASRAAGWYSNPDGTPKDRNPAEMIALIHSEASEMLEGVRKGQMDEHLPDRRSEEVEAADILIRLFDYAAYRGLDGAVKAKMAYNARRADHKLENRNAPGGKAF